MSGCENREVGRAQGPGSSAVVGTTSKDLNQEDSHFPLCQKTVRTCLLLDQYLLPTNCKQGMYMYCIVLFSGPAPYTHAQ